jgi:hypothetical protein
MDGRMDGEMDGWMMGPKFRISFSGLSVCGNHNIHTKVDHSMMIQGFDSHNHHP